MESITLQVVFVSKWNIATLLVHFLYMTSKIVLSARKNNGQALSTSSWSVFSGSALVCPPPYFCRTKANVFLICHNASILLTLYAASQYSSSCLNCPCHYCHASFGLEDQIAGWPFAMKIYSVSILPRPILLHFGSYCVGWQTQFLPYSLSYDCVHHKKWPPTRQHNRERSGNYSKTKQNSAEWKLNWRGGGGCEN